MTEVEKIIGDELQKVVLPLNPDAAFEMSGATFSYLPASPETDITVEGVTYRAQVYRHWEQRDVQHIVYAPVGEWGNLTWFYRPNTPIPDPSLEGWFLDPNGNDANDGRTQETAWRTLTKASSVPESMNLWMKRGGEWAGTLTPANGVFISAYGEGDMPVIRLPGGKRGIDARGRHNVAIDGIAIYGPEYGIDMAGGGNTSVVGCQFNECGTGVNLAGFGIGAVVDGCWFGHNYETAPGMYGGVAVLIDGSSIEICNCRILDQATVAFELYVNGGENKCDGVYIHHNDVYNCPSLIEMASPNISRTVSNVTLEYNRVYNVAMWLSMHNVAHQTSGEGATFQNITLGNNTFVHVKPLSQRLAWAMNIPGAPKPGELYWNNNVFVLGDYWQLANKSLNWSNLERHNNIYWRLHSDTNLSPAANASEKVVDPLLVDMAGGNLRPTSSSWCCGNGIPNNIILDLDNVAVASPPSVGCYECL